GSLSTEPNRAHQECNDGNGLEDRALLFLRPPAQPAPDRHENARKPGEAAEHPVEEACSCIPAAATSGDRLQNGAKIGVETVENEQDTDRCADAARIGPSQKRDA